jgi:cation transport ATPase
VIHRAWDVSGLTCFADAIRLERHLRTVPGVHAAVVNPVTERVYLTFDRRMLAEDAAAAAIDHQGVHAWRAGH